VAGLAPVVAIDASVAPPVATVAIGRLVPVVVSGAGVSVPAAAVAMAALDPDQAGRPRTEVKAPAGLITVAGVTPAVASGGSIAVPAGAVTVAGVVPTLGDSNFANVTMLLHMDGSNNSTTFTDSSTNNYTSTAFGDAKISTTQSKFGSASGSFDGTGDYVRTAYTTKWNLGAGEFTIEMWFYANAFGGVLIAKDKNGFNFDWAIELVSSTSIRCYTNKTQSNLTVTVPTMNTGTWYHVALVRSLSGGTYTNKIYLDGTSYGSNTMTITNDSTDYITIGCASWNNPGVFFNGYIDELRVTKAARYNSNFTPSNAPFPDA